MRNDSLARQLQAPTESLFSDDEAPTCCSRPTPLLPPPGNELLDFGSEPAIARSSNTYAIQMPSLPSTLGAGELPPFPQDPVQAVDMVNGLLAKRRVRGRASPLTPVPPLVVIAIEAPTSRRRKARRVIARRLFVLGFSGLLGVFGYTFRLQLASALHELQASIAVLTTTR